MSVPMIDLTGDLCMKCFFPACSHRSQENESLRVVIELSKQDMGSGVPPSEEGEEVATGEPPSDFGNPLLDFSETGVCVHAYVLVEGVRMYRI